MTRSTNPTIACFDGPSFQDAKGSVEASAILGHVKVAIPSAIPIALCTVFTCFSLVRARGGGRVHFFHCLIDRERSGFLPCRKFFQCGYELCGQALRCQDQIIMIEKPVVVGV